MKRAEADIEIPSHFIFRPDGTRIRYFDTRVKRPALVLANGLGGPLAAFRPHLPHLAEHFRILTWDYRGTYASTLGSPPGDLGVVSHAGDLAAILDDADVPRASLVGWSMGVQVALELYRSAPERLDRLVFMNGTYGHALRHVDLPFGPELVPRLVKALRRMHFLGRPLLRTVGHAPRLHELIRRLGFVAPTFDMALLREVITDFETLDFRVYFELLERLGEHDGSDVLDAITLPTLVITGTQDILTPPALAERMARRIPGARLVVLEGASHYAAAEFPERVVDEVRSFLLAPLQCSPPFARMAASS